MGIFSKLGSFFKRPQEPVDLDARAPQTGVKYKDLLVLNQLQQAGANLTAPRHVLYYLYFKDCASAETAASAATTKAFETTIREPSLDDATSWTVVCERKSYVLSMEAVRDNTDYFEELAARLGGDYDGWEASAE